MFKLEFMEEGKYSGSHGLWESKDPGTRVSMMPLGNVEGQWFISDLWIYLLSSSHPLTAFINTRLVKSSHYWPDTRTWKDSWSTEAYIKKLYQCYHKDTPTALAGVAPWIECQPANQRITDSISNLGHIPGFWARSPVGVVWEAHTHWCYSPSLFPSLPL